MVAQVWETPDVRKVWGSCTRNNGKTPRYGFSRWMIKRVQNRRNHKNITWMRDFDFEWTTGHDQTLGKMGLAFAHNWPQMTIPKESLTWLSSRPVYVPLHSTRRNMNSPHNTGDQTVIVFARRNPLCFSEQKGRRKTPKWVC